MNPIHTVQAYLSKIHFNIIIPYMCLVVFFHQALQLKLFQYSSFPPHANYPAQLILLGMIILNIQVYHHHHHHRRRRRRRRRLWQ
jgi:hypothetical protein